LEVQASINANRLLVNSVPITQSFSWKYVNPSSPPKLGIYQNTYRVSVGASDFSQDILLDVTGVGSNKRGYINAKAYLINGKRIDQAQQWKYVDSQQLDIYFDNNVGLGKNVSSPKAKLDVDGAIFLKKDADTRIPAQGTFRYSGTNYQGYVDNQWKSIPGISPTSYLSILPSQVSIFENANSFTSSYLFTWSNEKKSLALSRNSNSISYPAMLFIQPTDTQTPLYSVINSQLTPNIHLSTLGKLGIGMPNTSSTSKIVVSGNVESNDLYLNGVNLRFAIFKGDVFLRNISPSEPNKADIYYNRGQVSIGRVYPGDFLQITSPYKIDDDRTPYIHPAITFSNDNESYTLGTPLFGSNKFRLERSTRLGTQVPLIVARENYFGINLEDPGANFHVSGNYGFLVSGSYSDITPLPYTFSPENSILFFYSAQAAFRSGYIDTLSSAQGLDWSEANIGKYSQALGYNVLGYGNYSTVFGGAFNQAFGAYDTVLGGYNNLSGLP
jgi:hypothetical protein